jgi:hypothetical protein
LVPASSNTLVIRQIATRAVAIVLVVVLLGGVGGCRQRDKKEESQPAAVASSQPVAVTTPTPAADATPFLITNSTKWNTVEEFDYQWKANQPSIHFKMEIPDKYNDPGDFIRIHIQPQGRPDFVLSNDDGWMEYNYGRHVKDFFEESEKRNLVQSKYVLILPASKNPDDSPLILLRSWGYASNPDRLHIIGLQPSGDPLLLFNDEFYLEDLSDMDGDGVAEVIGLPCFSEGLAKGVRTYAPYQVYKIAFPIQKLVGLSIPLTEQYTKQKYDGWAGPECSQKHVIVDREDKTKKPLVMTEEEFRKMGKSPGQAH